MQFLSRFGVILLVQQVLWLGVALTWPPVLERSVDSGEYEKLSEQPLFSTPLLASRRTLGFPLWLRLVKTVSPDLGAFVACQLALVCGASTGLYLGLRRLGMPAVWSCLAASALLYADPFAWQELAMVMSDVSATAWGLMSVACLMLTVPRGSRPAAWVGLVLTTMAAYHVRPAQLWLVGGLPALGLALWCLPSDAKRTAPPLRRLGQWTLATALPLLLFCGVRYAAVGHFGLVSFGGTNVIGLAGALLEPADVPALPAEVQPLAREILQRRAASLTLRDGSLYSWQSPRMGTHSVNRLAMEEQYNRMIWDIAVPAAQDLLPADPVAQNRAQFVLSKHVLRRHASAYVNWLVKAYAWGWRSILASSGRLHAAAVLALALALILYVQRRARRGWRELGDLQGARVAPAVELPLLLATLYFALSMALIVLVEPAIARYVEHAAVLFFPAAVNLAGWLGWEALRPSTGARPPHANYEAPGCTTP